jgi:uncharacterized membrane protein YdfJ with MMPL/SSD domain
VVVLLAFLLLMLVFRSLVIPAIASVMNLLSVGAALGVMNALFGWGWGSSILGIGGTTATRLSPVRIHCSLMRLTGNASCPRTARTGRRT